MLLDTIQKTAKHGLAFCWLMAAAGVGGQTFTAFTLFDTVPIDGNADMLTGSDLSIGQLNETGYPFKGLCRARLIVQLPPLPSGSQLGGATLRLYLQSNTGNAGNASFGPLSLYHDFHPNSLQLSDTDYADTNYVLVTNSVVTPTSPVGRYYEIDVSAQVAKDYASDGATPFSDFRLQVDGLQFVGGSHFYLFDSGGGGHPPQLQMLFGGPSIPIRPLLICQQTNSVLSLSWPTNYTGFILESASIPNAQTWNTVTNQPLTTNEQFQVHVQASETQGFFRLHQP